MTLNGPSFGSPVLGTMLGTPGGNSSFWVVFRWLYGVYPVYVRVYCRQLTV